MRCKININVSFIKINYTKIAYLRIFVVPLQKINSMTNGLSILIPCRDYICTPLAEQLARQAASVKGLAFEVIVIDDGSTNVRMVEVNASISRKAYCRHISLAENQGRAKVRNMLAREAQYDNLLFIDCKHSLPDSSFVRRYMEHSDCDVVNGGIRIEGDSHLLRGNLRFIYEKSAERAHTAERRSGEEYRDFHTANFMVKRSIMLAYPFDETITRYGYEDVLFGKLLKEAGIHITHIDNPVVFNHFESNKSFVAKTDEAMCTLHEYASQLEGYSTLLHIYNKVSRFRLAWLLRLVWHICGRAMRSNLVSNKPNLNIFKLYKLSRYAITRTGQV